MEKTKKILEKEQLEKEDLIYLLSLENEDEIELLRQKAEQTLFDLVGEKVFFRGLIEFSNICTSDCFYCGIRKSNPNVSRYTLDEEEILEQVKQCAYLGYGSIVLQSGERSDDLFIDFLVKIVKKIKQMTVSEKQPDGLGITLCVGEQTEENYRRLYDAGAHRYLLRIDKQSRIIQKFTPQNKIRKQESKLSRHLKMLFQVGTML